MEKTLYLAESYSKSALMNRAAHYRAAKIANQRHIFLGAPATLISTIVGTAIFSSLNGNPDNSIKIFTGLISLLGAGLSALQTFFKFSELAEKHRIAGANYGDVKRKLDLFSLKYELSEHPPESEAVAELSQLAEALSRLAQESPDIPDAAYRKAIEMETSRNNQKKSSQ
ncbi:SLATT domain-containing protein [Anabaena sp. AL93]|jgi:hypothetical protein|uniref:SLATT domain-containing protein n=1 Tax=Anabaena sp. AL93 TaxID=1678133 RepID=UPI0007FD6E75|nr:SLATT domain-containing protein [Anabaena sp. AL93]OBQ17958.1 MAG: hypothetical protein AN486_13435 [Anabaena sp. AL93]